MRVVVKGAPEIVMKMCTKQMNSQGLESYMSEQENTRILNEEILDKYAKQYGYRTFVYAYKDVDSNDWEALQAHYDNFRKESDREIVEQNLTFLCAFGIEDKLR